MPTETTSRLRNVFGTLSHEPPSDPVAAEEPELAPSAAPDEPRPGTVTSQHSGLVLRSEIGFDGDPVAQPWNQPESALVEWLSTAEVELVEERVLDGSGGIFWARMRDVEGEPRSVFLKFDGIGKQSVYRLWGQEYLLDQGRHDLLARELAAYEICKLAGSEDLVPPLTARDIDMVPLISDSVRERLASILRIAPVAVDERLGTAAIVQLCPRNADNFLEHWGSLGPDNKTRWTNATNRLRHSLYRCLAIDFLLGVQDRPLSGYFYNKTSDRVAIMDLALSFPHPGYSAEKYASARSEGWGRKPFPGLDRLAETGPAHSWDLSRIFIDLPEENRLECHATLEQVTGAIEDPYAVHASRVLLEHGLPIQCVAGFLSRLSYMTVNPSSVIKSPIDYIRNVILPIRRGIGIEDEVNASLINYVNTILTEASGEPIEFEVIAEEPVEQG